MSITIEYSQFINDFINNSKSTTVSNQNVSVVFSANFLQEKLSAFNSTVSEKKIGFFRLPEEGNFLEECTKVYKNFSDRTHFFQVGIGGSSLGPEMLVRALRPAHNHTVFTYVNNIDPEELQGQLDAINEISIKQVLFYIVSKSGGTAETMAALSIITNYLQAKGIAEKDFKNYLVFATDPEKGDLRKLSKEWNVSTLPVPSNVGGRFSVLTPVGILPALFAGINVKKLLQGAGNIIPKLLNKNVEENDLLKIASVLFALRNEYKITQTVMMPYSSKMREFSAWFIQLWAESLGKKLSRNGEQIFAGLTPIPSYGATDQHSQMQLFMEGPKDKCIFFVEIKNFATDFSLNNKWTLSSSLQKLSPHTLGKLMRAELQGTLKALQEAGRPYINIKIDYRDEEHLGGLIMLLESLTVLMGHYLNIDPFDQPGVEAGKIYAFEWLSRS